MTNRSRFGELLGTRRLAAFGVASALAFTVACDADDILDVVGDQEVIGKDVGSDQERGKATYVALLGLEEARVRARELRDVGVAALAPLGASAEPLRRIAHYIVDRSS